MTHPFTAPAIVVGVDGSRAGIHAALWAVDEAVGRELPLRLVAAAEHGDSGHAQEIVAAAAEAVRATGRPVSVDTEVVLAGPTPALVEASRNAVMLCVGDVGLRHFDPTRVGSTAAALVASAHCPVAVVRGGRQPGVSAAGWVVTELDQTPDSAAVLQYAVDEARMRRVPLRVVGTWQSDGHDPQALAQSGKLVSVQLDRRLEQWRRRYPDLDVLPIAVHGSGLGYLADNSAAIQLVVVGARNTAAVGELLGPAGLSALHDTDCSVLVVDAQRLL
ncbi:universal stress protein [Mycolicibacterium sp.]|uniref:universal stress protein n=1 Tax=Mycolicibacterium sp. TaxID=2320850 RepID=UPI0028ACFC6F|nr:universal stress protein [Mycolicibacterium sp.]